MNKLSKSLLVGLLEQESKIVALYGGGFKPPTKGHFEVVKKTLNDHPEIDKLYIIIGSGLRNNISQDESHSIWEIYKKYLSDKVEIIKAQSPLTYIKNYLRDNPENQIYTVVGTREGDENDIKDFIQRKDFFEKYSGNVTVLNIVTGGGISGTQARKAAAQSKESFLKFVPDEINKDEQDIIYDYVQSVLKENISRLELDSIEKIADKWFEKYNIDIDFTKHFYDRVNDYRNGKPINQAELLGIFKKTKDKYGKKLSASEEDFEAVLKNIQNDLNLPFVLNYDSKQDQFKLIAKTIMRKKNFKTPDPILTLENDNPKPDLISGIKSLTKYMVGLGMNITPLPKLQLIENDIENASNFFGKTAFYDPNQRLIVLYTKNRHNKDISRSFAHEMIHHLQNCEGRLENITTNNTNEDGDLPEIEREAYEKGNMIFRNWEDSIKNTPKQLNEGRYDKITNSITSDIFNKWKTSFNENKSHSVFKSFYESDDFTVEVTAKIAFIPGYTKLRVDGSMGVENTSLEVDFKVGKEMLPEYWEEISMNLKDVVRHEIEHATQTSHDVNKRQGKFIEDDTLVRRLINAKLLPRSQYFKLAKEVDANLQGMYFRAKKEKRPFINVLNTYLDSQNLTPEENEEIMNIWRTRAKSLSLPKF